MSQQYAKWAELVKQKLREKNWTYDDLAQAVGLRSYGHISDMLNNGKGSVNLRIRVSKLLKIREPWKTFEEE